MLELCLQKILVSDDKTANKPFYRTAFYVHFFVKRQRNEPNESMFRCAKQQVFLARKASIAQSANEKRCAHGAAALMDPASSRATDDAPRRLTRTRPDACGAFAFAASKRTAKIEKLTRIGIGALADLLGENLLRFEPRERGYKKTFPKGRVAAAWQTKKGGRSALMGEGSHIGG